MFKGNISHTEETCLRLAKVQNQCFGRPRKVIRLVLAAIPVFLGYAAGLDTTQGVLLIVFACIFYYKTSSMYERDAKKAYEQTPKKFLAAEYEFGEEQLKIHSGGVEKTVEYSSLYALVTDKKYGYLFINSQQAYMFQLQRLDAGDGEELCRFLQKKSGLTWKNAVTRPSFVEFLKGQKETEG